MSLSDIKLLVKQAASAAVVIVVCMAEATAYYCALQISCPEFKHYSSNRYRCVFQVPLWLSVRCGFVELRAQAPAYLIID